LLKIFLGCGERNGETSSRDFYALQDLEAELKSSTFLLLKCPRRILLLFRPPYDHLFNIFGDRGGPGWAEVGKQTKTRKFFSSFRYRKSANFLGVPARKSANLKINPQITKQH
jgi:hypothetical protein